jgi:signal peptidase
LPLTIGLVAVIWFALGIFPIKPVGIATGSMAPELNVGDLTIIKKCTANDVKVQDIIEYQMDGYTVIHRVIEKRQENGEFLFVTKGDNNNAPDSAIVREDQLIGKVLYKIKYVAMPTVWIHELNSRTVDVETGN